MKKKLLILHGLILTTCLQAQIYYSDIASSQGINHQYEGGIGGGGVSFCDFNNDGWDDITLSTADGASIQFYKNNAGSFELLPTLIEHQGIAKHILWVDFDNDGDKDIYLTTYGESNRLYENTGNLNFIDITSSAELPTEPSNSFGACWGDYDRDGWLDLYYTERKIPANMSSNENRLFHNNADGTFTEVTIESGAQDPGKTPFCSAFVDYDNDKWPDLYIANDKKTINALLQNNGDGTFTNTGDLSHANIKMDGMGIAVGDYDNDGWQDLYLANIPDGNKLLHNLGHSDTANAVIFEEIAESSGVGFFGIAWSTNFFDADNDGNLDLYVSSLVPNEDDIPNTFYLNEGNGHFTETDAGFLGDDKTSFNNAIGDYNQDGYPDIIVGGYAPNKAKLWNNAGGGNNWIKIELEGVLSNRSGIGSKIECYINGQYQMRYTHCGIGFMSQNSSTEIIGIANAETIDSLVITWSTGHIDRLFDLEVNQKIDLTEGSSTNGDITVDADVELTIVATENVTNELSDILLFPNPSSAKVIIQSKTAQFSHFMIVNSEGKRITSGVLQGNSTEINLNTLTNGIYHILIWNKKGERVVKKIIKQY